MPRRPAPFRQSDIERLVRGAIKGGWPVGGFQIVVDGGRITLLPVAQAEAPVSGSLDDELEAFRQARGYG